MVRLLAALLALIAGGAHAQPRIAVVLATAPAAASVRLEALQEGLRQLGHVPGRTVVIDARSWLGDKRPLAELAAAVAGERPAVIVAEGNSTIAALKRATQSVPIVMTVVGDPVGSGFVASLARPGGNITGLSNTAEQLSGKRLEVLKELVPAMRRVAVMRNPRNPTHAIFLRETQAAAAGIGVTLAVFDFASEADLEPAFAAMAREGVHGAVLLPQPLGVALRQPIADMALRHRVPVVFPSPETVEVGGLASYGPSHTDLWRRAASHVDRILKGARPAELPVEEPTRFELVLNARTARALGLAVPAALQLRADRVLE